MHSSFKTENFKNSLSFKRYTIYDIRYTKSNVFVDNKTMLLSSIWIVTIFIFVVNELVVETATDVFQNCSEFKKYIPRRLNRG